MRGRKRAATVVVTVLAVLGVAFPGTAAARSYFPPVNPAAGITVTVTVSAPEETGAGSTLASVSWGD
jgi:hypothetical protein